jgi:hypothetical protein
LDISLLRSAQRFRQNLPKRERELAIGLDHHDISFRHVIVAVTEPTQYAGR